MPYLVLFALLLFFIPDAYIYYMYTRAMASWAWTGILLAPTLLAVGTLLYILVMGISSEALFTFFDLTLCFALPKMIFFLVDACGRLLAQPALHWGNLPRVPHAISYVALALAGIVFLAQLYGSFFGNKRLTVKQTAITLPSLPASFDGYRLVQLSDLHLGTYLGDTTFVSRIVQEVNVLQPDLIVFTGDLVNSEAQEIAPYVHLLSQLSARDGVISILGNHDYCLYRFDRDTLAARRDLEHICETERTQLGWKLLRNEHLALQRDSDFLYIVGVENVGRPPFPHHGDLSRSLLNIPPDAPCILLSHDPYHWRAEVCTPPFQRIGLTLSGHTHAMQMKIFGWSPASLMMKEWAGLYKSGEQQLYVSTGIGGTVPYRLGAWPCIEEITLHAK